MEFRVNSCTAATVRDISGAELRDTVAEIEDVGDSAAKESSAI